MVKKTESLLGTISIITSILVGAVVLSEKACDRYVSSAYAQEKFSTYEQIHRDTSQTVNKLAITVGQIDERTRLCE